MFIGRLIALRAAVRAVVAIALTTTALLAATAVAAPAAPAAPAARAAPAAIPPGAIFIGTAIVENEWSHRCLDEDITAGPFNGAKVQIWACNGSNQQLWSFWLQPGGNGHTFFLVNYYSGLCLDADTNTINRNGTKIQVYGCNNWSNQNWTFPLVSGAPVFVKNMWEGFGNESDPSDILDQDDNTPPTTNGARAQLYQFMESMTNAATNQEWRVYLG